MGSVCPSLFGGLDGCTKPLSLNWWDVGVNLHIKSYSLEGSEFSNCRLFIEMAGDGPWKHNSTWAGLAWIAVKANGSKVTAETRSVRPY
ncbi:hypothetical protein CsSME_00018683 [Camellia sinensis var. sinensis]